MVAKQMNYRPMASARALRAGRTHTIGVIFPYLPKRGSQLLKVYAPALEAITECLIGHHYHVSLAAAAEISGTDNGRRRSRLFDETSVDGALVIQQPTVELAQDLEDRSLRYVVLDAEPAPGRRCVCVRTDHGRAAEMIVCHLVELGHKRIALNSTVRLRIRGEEFSRGYLRALAVVGLPAIPGWDQTDRSLLPKVLPREIDSAYLEALWSRPDPPTAIIAADDQEATGIISWLMKRGNSVPCDVSVAALHDIGLIDQMPYVNILPSITCKANMQREIASVAVEKLLHLIEQPNDELESVFVEPKVVIRESTGPCPNGQPA